MKKCTNLLYFVHYSAYIHLGTKCITLRYNINDTDIEGGRKKWMYYLE